MWYWSNYKIMCWSKHSHWKYWLLGPTPHPFQELQETHRHVVVWESALLEHHVPGSLCDIFHRTPELGTWDRRKQSQCPACQYKPQPWRCRFTNHTMDLLNQNLQDLAQPSLLQQVLQVTLPCHILTDLNNRSTSTSCSSQMALIPAMFYSCFNVYSFN